jgi:FdhD protein
MLNYPTARIKLKRASATQLMDVDDELAVEEPLEIKLEYGSKARPVCKTISVTMRTPGHDEELALGFLWTEGILQHRRQIARTSLCLLGNKVVVTLQENEEPQLQKAERNFYAASSCGVCGKASIEAIRTVSVYKDLADDICLQPALFYCLEESLRKQQALFESTGGLHAAALFDLAGNFLSLREDVGRHNALDKLIGAAFLADSLPLNNRILLLSGRAGFELVQKAAMAGIKIVAAVGAPSSLAVQLAQESDMTLIGFLRNKGFNIYSGERRICLKKAP